MTTFVLIPGGWRGSWAFEKVVPLLEQAGHTVHALTLTGLSSDDDDTTVATANLDTHIGDVLRVLETVTAERVTLVGHSYGGMVIAGAADRAADRIERVVHIDAYVPADGDSCWSLTSEAYRRAFAVGAAESGFAVRPPDGPETRTTRHPLASFLQAIRLTGAGDRVPRRDFVYCSGWEGTPFTQTYERLRDDPAWRVHEAPFGHDLPKLAPEAVAAILLDRVEPVSELG
jgi:pimeloyl-ACP methyl ester carboxylesterase